MREQLHVIDVGRFLDEVDAKRVERLARAIVEVIAAGPLLLERRLVALRAQIELPPHREPRGTDRVLGLLRRDVLLARAVAALAADAARQRVVVALRRLVAVAGDAEGIEDDVHPRVAAERHRIEVPLLRLRVVVDRQVDQPAVAPRVQR